MTVIEVFANRRSGHHFFMSWLVSNLTGKIDNKIKELTTQKDAIKEALTGVVGVTATGVEVRWTEVAGPKQVDKEKIQDMLGFVPTIKGKDSLRLSIKHNGGK